MSTIEGFGLRVDLPAGWDGRVYRRVAQGDEATHAVCHLATFALPAGSGDYGNGAVLIMGPTDVLICLVEFDPSAVTTPLFSAGEQPRRLFPGDFSRSTLQRAQYGQAGAQRFFNAANRAWSLYVVLGAEANAITLTDTVSQVLQRITIEP